MFLKKEELAGVRFLVISRSNIFLDNIREDVKIESEQTLVNKCPLCAAGFDVIKRRG